jgi:branched-chain amino acid transport system substrate-binding protein
MQRNILTMFLEKNPTINGQKVEIVYQDGQCSGDAARSAVEALLSDPEIQVIYGGGCSGEVLAAADLLNEKEIVALSATATSPEITTAGDFIFRTVPADNQNSAKLVEHFTENKFTKPVVISQLTDFAQAYRKDIIANLEAAGVTPLLDETYGDDVTDFRTLVQKVKETNADAIFIFSNFPTTGGTLVRQIREAGLTAQIYGSDPFVGVEFIENTGDTKEGLILSKFSADLEDETIASLIDEYVTKFGDEPGYESYFSTSYDAIQIIFEALENVGNNGPAVRDYLYENTFDVLSGEIDFDENGDTSLTPTLQIFKGDEIVNLES